MNKLFVDGMIEGFVLANIGFSPILATIALIEGSYLNFFLFVVTSFFSYLTYIKYYF